ARRLPEQHDRSDARRVGRASRFGRRRRARDISPALRTVPPSPARLPERDLPGDPTRMSEEDFYVKKQPRDKQTLECALVWRGLPTSVASPIPPVRFGWTETARSL